MERGFFRCGWNSWRYGGSFDSNREQFNSFIESFFHVGIFLYLLSSSHLSQQLLHYQSRRLEFWKLRQFAIAELLSSVKPFSMSRFVYLPSSLVLTSPSWLLSAATYFCWFFRHGSWKGHVKHSINQPSCIRKKRQIRGNTYSKMILISGADKSLKGT